MSCSRPIVITEQLSRKIAFIGNLAACCAVALHTWVTPAEGSVAWWLNRLCLNGGLMHMAVPVFFGLSGFLLAGKMSGDGWYGRLIRSKIKTLLVPYACFCLIWWAYIGVVARVAAAGGITLGAVVPRPVTLGNLIDMLGLNVNQTPGLYVLWFVRNLFLLFLACPVFIFLKKRLEGGTLLFGLFVVYLWWEWSDGEARTCGMFFSRTFSLRGLFYFCAGIYMRYHGGLLTGFVTRRWACVLFVMSPMIMIASVFFRPLEPIAVLLCIASCLALLKDLDVRRFVDRTLSFPLYCLHPFVLLSVNGLFYAVIGRCVVERSFVIAIVRWGLTIVVSVAVAKLIRRFAPRMAMLMFGGR